MESKSLNWPHSLEPCFTHPDYKPVSKENPAKRKFAHGMFYAETDEQVTIGEPIRIRAMVQMQLRFDGSLGFPGGSVESWDDSVVDGLNRECMEEIGLNLDKFSFSEDDFLNCFSRDGNSYYFYGKPVSTSEFREIECDALHSRDFGVEMLGIIRVPLYTLKNGYGGFPNFLKNNFVAHSRSQLLYSLHHFKLLSLDEIRQSVQIANT